MQNKTTEIATIRQAVRLQEWSELMIFRQAHLRGEPDDYL